MSGVVIPDGLVASQHESAGAAGRRFLSELPTLIDTFVDRWRLTVVGPAMHGMAALIVPVERPDRSLAVAKFQLRDEETVGEASALRVWDGDRAVKLLDHDESTGAMLLERLDTSMSLAIEHAAITARDGVVIIAQLLARLTSVHAPAGIRRLEDIVGQMLDDLPYALSRIDGGEDRRLLVACGDAVTDVVHEAGDRLLGRVLQKTLWDIEDRRPLAADHLNVARQLLATLGR